MRLRNLEITREQHQALKEAESLIPLANLLFMFNLPTFFVMRFSKT